MKFETKPRGNDVVVQKIRYKTKGVLTSVTTSTKKRRRCIVSMGNEVKSCCTKNEVNLGNDSLKRFGSKENCQTGVVQSLRDCTRSFRKFGNG